MRETNGSFDSCNSCKQLVPSRLLELHVSKLPFVSRIEFLRSKLLDFSAHVSGVTYSAATRQPARWWRNDRPKVWAALPGAPDPARRGGLQ